MFQGKDPQREDFLKRSLAGGMSTFCPRDLPGGITTVRIGLFAKSRAHPQRQEATPPALPLRLLLFFPKGCSPSAPSLYPVSICLGPLSVFPNKDRTQMSALITLPTARDLACVVGEAQSVQLWRVCCQDAGG